MLVEQPVTGELALVQVKSAAEPGRTRPLYPDIRQQPWLVADDLRPPFACRAASSPLADRRSGSGARRTGAHDPAAGLFDWLVERAGLTIRNRRQRRGGCR